MSEPEQCEHDFDGEFKVVSQNGADAFIAHCTKCNNWITTDLATIPPRANRPESQMFGRGYRPPMPAPKGFTSGGMGGGMFGGGYATPSSGALGGMGGTVRTTGGMGSGGGMFGGGYAPVSGDPMAGGMGFFGSAETPLVLQLKEQEKELTDKHNKLTERHDALLKQIEQANKRETELNKELAERNQIIKQLEQNDQDRYANYVFQNLAHYVDNDALKDETILARFKSLDVDRICKAYVMSVDIRRSTDLMLKAKSPQHFRDFITVACRELREIIKCHYGVFDKFTGDGILAFFPNFISDPHSGYRALQAAAECHSVFSDVYRAHRGSFTAVLANTGLGIGIDYGEVGLVEIFGNITVVGAPVVYACRLGSGKPGTTLLNQQAYDEILREYSRNCAFEEIAHPIKNEGDLLVYRPRLNEPFAPGEPEWKTAARAAHESADKMQLIKQKEATQSTPDAKPQPPPSPPTAPPPPP